jgi:hypothetical protein
MAKDLHGRPKRRDHLAERCRCEDQAEQHPKTQSLNTVVRRWCLTKVFLTCRVSCAFANKVIWLQQAQTQWANTSGKHCVAKTLGKHCVAKTMLERLCWKDYVRNTVVQTFWLKHSCLNSVAKHRTLTQVRGTDFAHG